MLKSFSLLALLLFAFAALAQAPAPRLASVTPDSGNATTEFTAAGENLKAGVAEMYLTDGKNDLKVVIVSQEPEAIKFKPDPATKPGRYSLMILTGDRKMFLEQPVRLTIE
jgi:hypothetical protein